ncbi:hypothetical protein CRENBAI_020899 [Crenichthys baileyi]|uniref:Uncharacterized protein n=1 Tax=Crenichthys baileyi TaxID=28760 RepID=A0AAV9RT22_9TELE
MVWHRELEPDDGWTRHHRDETAAEHLRRSDTNHRMTHATISSQGLYSNSRTDHSRGPIPTSNHNAVTFGPIRLPKSRPDAAWGGRILLLSVREDRLHQVEGLLSAGEVPPSGVPPCLERRRVLATRGPTRCGSGTAGGCDIGCITPGMGSSVAVQVHPVAVGPATQAAEHKCPGAADHLLGAEALLAFSQGQACALLDGQYVGSVPRQPSGWDLVTAVFEGGPEAVDLGVPSARLLEGDAPTRHEDCLSCQRLPPGNGGCILRWYSRSAIGSARPRWISLPHGAQCIALCGFP